MQERGMKATRSGWRERGGSKCFQRWIQSRVTTYWRIHRRKIQRRRYNASVSVRMFERNEKRKRAREGGVSVAQQRSECNRQKSREKRSGIVISTRLFCSDEPRARSYMAATTAKVRSISIRKSNTNERLCSAGWQQSTPEQARVRLQKHRENFLSEVPNFFYIFIFLICYQIIFTIRQFFYKLSTNFR